MEWKFIQTVQDTAGLLCYKGLLWTHAYLAICQPLQTLQQSWSPAHIITSWSPFPCVGLSICPCWISSGPGGPFFQPVQVPLDGSSAFEPVDCVFQFGVICKLGIIFSLPSIFLLSKFIQGRAVSCMVLHEVPVWEILEGHLLGNLRAFLLYQEWLNLLKHLSPTPMLKSLTENYVDRLWDSCAVFQFLAQAVLSPSTLRN